MKMKNNISVARLKSNKWLQRLILGLVFASLGFFITLYCVSLGMAIGGMELNSQLLEKDSNLQKVIDYSISYDGVVEGTLSDGSVFKTDISEVVLVSKLPDSSYCLYSEPTLIVEPSDKFANNFILGSGLLYIFVIFFILFTVFNSKHGREFIVFGSKVTRLCISASLILLLICVIGTKFFLS